MTLETWINSAVLRQGRISVHQLSVRVVCIAVKEADPKRTAELPTDCCWRSTCQFSAQLLPLFSPEVWLAAALLNIVGWQKIRHLALQQSHGAGLFDSGETTMMRKASHVHTQVLKLHRRDDYANKEAGESHASNAAPYSTLALQPVGEVHCNRKKHFIWEAYQWLNVPFRKSALSCYCWHSPLRLSMLWNSTSRQAICVDDLARLNQDTESTTMLQRYLHRGRHLGPTAYHIFLAGWGRPHIW